MAYSVDLRKKALALIEEKKNIKEISRLLGIGYATLHRWKKRAAEGRLAAHYPKSKVGKIDKNVLEQYVKENPDAYLQEIADGIGSKRSTVYHALKRWKITRKKRRRSTESGMNKSVQTMLKK